MTMGFFLLRVKHTQKRKKITQNKYMEKKKEKNKWRTYTHTWQYLQILN